MSIASGCMQGIQDAYPEWQVVQVQAKALFVATHPTTGAQMLFSYRTLVGRKRIGEQWHITTERMSKTTTSHCNMYAKMVDAVRVPEIV